MMTRSHRYGLFEFAKYLSVGGSTAVLYFVLLVITNEGLKLDHIVAVGISYPIAIGFHFTANKLFTFKSHGTHVKREIFRYLCVAFVNYLLTLGIVHIVVDLGGQSTYVGAVLAIAVTIGLGYGMTKIWVFHQGK